MNMESVVLALRSAPGIALMVLVLIGLIVAIVLLKRSQRKKELLARAYSEKMREEELDERLRNKAKRTGADSKKPYEIRYGQEDPQESVEHMNADAIKVHLIVRSGSQERKYMVNIKDELFIGKSETNGIILDEPTVSGTHCCLVNYGGELYVTDMGSTNGTQLQRKSKEVSVGEKPIRIQSGDTINTGGVLTDIYFLK